MVVAIGLVETRPGLRRALPRRSKDAAACSPQWSSRRNAAVESSTRRALGEHLAHFHTSGAQLVTHSLDFGDGQVHALGRAGGGRRDVRAKLNRAPRAWRRELDHAEVITACDVGVEPRASSRGLRRTPWPDRHPKPARPRPRVAPPRPSPAGCRARLRCSSQPLSVDDAATWSRWPVTRPTNGTSSDATVPPCSESPGCLRRSRRILPDGSAELRSCGWSRRSVCSR